MAEKLALRTVLFERMKASKRLVSSGTEEVSDVSPDDAAHGKNPLTPGRIC